MKENRQFCSGETADSEAMRWRRWVSLSLRRMRQLKGDVPAFGTAHYARPTVLHLVVLQRAGAAVPNQDADAAGAEGVVYGQRRAIGAHGEAGTVCEVEKVR